MTVVNPETQLSAIAEDLRILLGTNLSSVVAYGSVIRGNWLPSASDINLLLVLEESTPAAHEAIASILPRHRRVSPIIVGRRQLARTFRCFAPKFLSMRRNYRVLHGEDCLRHLIIDPAHERFLVEQALRNQRMRCTYAFVRLSADPKPYTQFVLKLQTAVVVQISEMLRLGGIEMPREHSQRLPVIQREIIADTTVLAELRAIKKEGRELRSDEIKSIHGRLYSLLDAAVAWIEQRWTSFKKQGQTRPMPGLPFPSSIAGRRGHEPGFPLSAMQAIVRSASAASSDQSVRFWRGKSTRGG